MFNLLVPTRDGFVLDIRSPLMAMMPFSKDTFIQIDLAIIMFLVILITAAPPPWRKKATPIMRQKNVFLGSFLLLIGSYFPKFHDILLGIHWYI